MKRLFVTFVSLSFFAATAISQGKNPVFTLPAGQHDLQELTALAAQIQRAPIRFDRTELAKAADLSVTLQTELRLDATGYREVVAALLFEQGLVLSDSENGTKVATVRSEEERGRFVVCTPEQVFANRFHGQRVRTSVPSRPDDLIRIHAIRPHVHNEAPGLWVHDRGDTVELTGTVDEVRFGLRLLAMFGDEPVAPANRPQWPAGQTLSWPGGRMLLADLIARFANELDANVLGEPEHRMLDLGEPATMTPDEWFAEATRVLANHHCALVCHHVGSRLFAMRSLLEPTCLQANAQAHYVPCEDVADEPTAAAIMTKVQLHKLSSMDGFLALRRFMAQNPATTMSSLGERTVVLVGPSHQVAHHVDVLLQTDSH